MDELPSLVRAGNMTFSGGAGMDGFYIKSFDGWGPVATKRQNESEPQAAGSFPAPSFPDDRTVVIEGSCRAPSAAKLQWYENQLAGLFSTGMGGQVFVSRAGVDSWANGTRANVRPNFDVVVWGSYATYQLTLYFADPRKYGDVNVGTPGVSPGEVLSHHYGNFEATSVLTVTGSAPGYTIYGPDGRAYVVTVPVVTGHPHSIDMKTSFLSIDGVKQFGAVARADTWTVPPGQVVSQSVLPTSGAVTLTVSTTDTYI